MQPINTYIIILVIQGCRNVFDDDDDDCNEYETMSTRIKEIFNITFR